MSFDWQTALLESLMVGATSVVVQMTGLDDMITNPILNMTGGTFPPNVMNYLMVGGTVVVASFAYQAILHYTKK